MTTCADLRPELGAYVLDGLDAETSQRVEEHLAGCAACRVERDELAALVPLLELARTQSPDVPARTRDRVVADAARRQGRRRWTMAAAAVAAAAALLGGLVGWQLAPSPAPVVAVPLESAEPYEATGWATFAAEDDRIVVALELAGLDSLPEPGAYEAWLSTYEGRVLSLGQLEPRDDGSVVATLSTEGDLGVYRGFWVTAEPDRRDPAHQGETVLLAPVPPRR
jgi:anti-sigma factor RsiW